MPTKSPTQDDRTMVGSERKTCPGYSSDDADVELISSDNVLFKVHSFSLQHASLVFRSMISMASSTAQRNPITLTDERLENSLVIRTALDIIYNFDIGKLKKDQDMFVLRYVIDFAKKWEMEIVIKTIEKEIWRRVDSRSEKPHLFRHFLIALALGDHDLAASYYKLSITKSSNRRSSSTVAPSTDHGLDSDSGNEDASEEQDEPEKEDEDDDWTSSSGDESESDQEPGMMLNMELPQSGSSAKILCPPPYLSDDLSGNLLNSSWSVSALDFDCMSYEHFLLLPPTVVWIIFQVQARSYGRRDQVECLEYLLNQAYPAPPAVRTSKKRKAQD